MSIIIKYSNILKIMFRLIGIIIAIISFYLLYILLQVDFLNLPLFKQMLVPLLIILIVLSILTTIS
ncbi:MAG: hypothetical protein QXY18_00290 [Nitrososphaerota archaeon]